MQARKLSLDATAGWTARARGHGPPNQLDDPALRGGSGQGQSNLVDRASSATDDERVVVEPVITEPFGNRCRSTGQNVDDVDGSIRVDDPRAIRRPLRVHVKEVAP